jgi:hypothetical protein
MTQGNLSPCLTGISQFVFVTLVFYKLLQIVERVFCFTNYPIYNLIKTSSSQIRITKSGLTLGICLCTGFFFFEGIGSLSRGNDIYLLR